MYDTSSQSRSATWQSTSRPDAQPHAYDPWLNPELFRGVLTKRPLAFLIDLVVLLRLSAAFIAGL